jgi:hexosaminidase
MLPVHASYRLLRENIMKILVLFAMLSALFSTCFADDSTRHLNIMPLPATYQFATGQLVIDQSFSVALTGYKEPRIERAVRGLVENLSRQTGIRLREMMADPSTATLVIHAGGASKNVQELGEDESYVLDVNASRANLTAANPLGAMHGLQTFLQLVETGADGFAVPAVLIQDRPRFPWRGLLIDACRHFIPLEAIKRNLDGMAAVKLNVLHLHLSENQGFRIESKKFPKLHELGSGGMYYRQNEIRDLIAYAQDRGIRVIPEFDMPGHSTAWFVGYPELASGPGPYQIERNWGIFDPAMDPTREETYKFLDKFIGEMAKLFPDRYFHIGGDEVNGKQWDANPKIQEFMRAHGLKSNADLQAYFNKRVQAIVDKHGKTMVGWDEVLHPDLPQATVLQSWRGPKSLAEAARKGYRSLLSSGYYLDLMWPASQHYAVDPLSEPADSLNSEEKLRILGGEACMWAEYISPENIDSRVWPRTGAIAERLWSPQDIRDTDSMYRRLRELSASLDWLGLTHNANHDRMLRRIAGTSDITALRVLADVVEPVKGYSRYGADPAKHPTSETLLNRLVDASSPESEVARGFANLVNAVASQQSNAAQAKIEMRAHLTEWRDNDARLQPYLQESFLLNEVAPLSQDLSSLGAAGLQALDYIDKNQTAPEDWTAQQLAIIDKATQPRAALLLKVAPAMRRLIEISASRESPASPK